MPKVQTREYKGYNIEYPKFRGDSWKVALDGKVLYECHSTHHCKNIITALVDGDEYTLKRLTGRDET